jgi:hypothetical protein
MPSFTAYALRCRRGLQALVTLARSSLDPELRPLIPVIRRVARELPARQEAQSLPAFLAELTPAEADLVGMDPERLRRLVDALARVDRRHPFGLCLRRALLRYHFLRRAGLPLELAFGVRIRRPHEQPGLAGHAWNTLDGRPWHEDEADYRGFTVLYRWPES